MFSFSEPSAAHRHICSKIPVSSETVEPKLH
jgi:hypothetical protein